MSDLNCTECGMTASYADANIADLRRSCGEGNDGVPSETETAGGSVRYVYSGSKHDWIET